MSTASRPFDPNNACLSGATLATILSSTTAALESFDEPACGSSFTTRFCSGSKSVRCVGAINPFSNSSSNSLSNSKSKVSSNLTAKVSSEQVLATRGAICAVCELGISEVGRNLPFMRLNDGALILSSSGFWEASKQKRCGN